MRRISSTRIRRGFTLVTGAVLSLGLIGMLGLAVDIGRMYINKNEAQTFVDAGALSAALELDGTAAGLARARTVAANENRWNFSAAPFAAPVVQFSNTGTGNWDANPASPAGYRFVNVSTTVTLPLYFLPVINGIMNTNISAMATAGQSPVTTYREGTLPMSPLSHDDTDTVNFGLVPGGIYTLRWSSNPTLPNSNGKSGSSGAIGTVASKPVFAGNVCYGDAVTTYNASTTTADSYTNNFINKAEAGGGSERGYIEETSAAVIRESIEGDYQSRPLTIGSVIEMTGGAKNTIGDALQNRVAQDTDSSSARYADYAAAGNGNGRRLVLVPINNYHPNYRIVGFRGFFLLPASNYNAGGNDPFCAEYIGPYTQGSQHSGAGGSGSFVVRLLQ